jgi:aminopeptidase
MAHLDPRVRQYATLLVERCIDAQPGWQVLVQTSVLARPLVDEVLRALGRRGAYPILWAQFDQWQYPADLTYVENAAVEQLETLSAIDRNTLLTCDARIVISAPENTRAGAGIDGAKLTALRGSFQEHSARVVSLEYPWVGCQFPCRALAQEAGLTEAQFAEFVYGACLLDWDELARSMAPIKAQFDATEEVRLAGDGTDLTFSLAGRAGMIDDGRVNMPGGEVFYCPVEDSVSGVVHFAEFPAVYLGNEVVGARLRFEGGRVVDASADAGEDFLVSMLDTDEGARRIGEFGIGCNPGITRHMRNTLYDEKIYGTVHLALGAGFPFLGGENRSLVHWDMVKDLRRGGRIECDGAVVQENGAWQLPTRA